MIAFIPEAAICFPRHSDTLAASSPHCVSSSAGCCRPRLPRATSLPSDNICKVYKVRGFFVVASEVVGMSLQWEVAQVIQVLSPSAYYNLLLCEKLTTAAFDDRLSADLC